MGTISLTLPADGETADASDVNNPLNTIAAVINGGIDADNIEAGGVIPNGLQSGTGTTWAWQSWTATLTNLSGGTQSSRYIQIGKTVFFNFQYVLGGAGVSGSVSFTLPVTASSSYNMNNNIIASAVFNDDATAQFYGIGRIGSTTSCSIFVYGAAVTYLNAAVLSSTVPFTWANADVISVSGAYEAA